MGPLGFLPYSDCTTLVPYPMVQIVLLWWTP